MEAFCQHFSLQYLFKYISLNKYQSLHALRGTRGMKDIVINGNNRIQSLPRYNGGNKEITTHSLFKKDNHSTERILC